MLLAERKRRLEGFVEEKVAFWMVKSAMGMLAHRSQMADWTFFLVETVR